MWKISSNVRNIPYKGENKINLDLKIIAFPLMAKILNIFLKNHNDNIVIPYSDLRLLRANHKHAKKDDYITITFIPKLYDNVQIDLVIEEINNYSGASSFFFDGNILEKKGIEYYYSSVQIAVTTGGETPSRKPPAKYYIYTPWADIIAIDADVVYLSGVKKL